MATLTLQGVRKSFGRTEVVHGIDLEIADREFVVLVGPSGCGKSTILRMIAGLEDVTSGRILIDGAVVNDREPKDRDIAMVFRTRALSAHDGLRQFGLRSALSRRAPGGNSPPGRRRRAGAGNYPASRSYAARIVGRAAAARGHGPPPSSVIRACFCSTSRYPISMPGCGPMRTELKKLRARLSITTIFVHARPGGGRLSSRTASSC